MLTILLYNKRLKQITSITSGITVVLILLFLLATFLGQLVVRGPYDSGYSHGFSDALNGGHPYLEASGGQSGHIARFMQGYNDGYTVGTQRGQAIISQRPALSSPASADPNSQQLTNNTDDNSYAIFLFLIIGIILVIVWKLRHRCRKYKKRHSFPDSLSGKGPKKTMSQVC